MIESKKHLHEENFGEGIRHGFKIVFHEKKENKYYSSLVYAVKDESLADVYIEYKHDEWVYPKYGPLAVFDEIRHVIHFAVNEEIFYKTPENFLVFVCQYIPSKSNALWYYYKKSNIPVSTELPSLPMGTRLASAIRLIGTGLSLATVLEVGGEF